MMRTHHQANNSEIADEMREHQVYERMSKSEVIQDKSRASHYREELRNMIIGYETSYLVLEINLSGRYLLTKPQNSNGRPYFRRRATYRKRSLDIVNLCHSMGIRSPTSSRMMKCYTKHRKCKVFTRNLKSHRRIHPRTFTSGIDSRKLATRNPGTW